MNFVLRDIKPGDLRLLAELLSRIPQFDLDDCSVALELLKIILEQSEQKDYYCIVAADPSDVPLGYTCFGPTPLTDGTFDLYWIAVNPACAGNGIGTRLLQAMEAQVRRMHGRLLIIETSSSKIMP